METYVATCPQNITEVLESSARLGCGRDKYGSDQYLCVPKTDKTGLIELCYNGTMGLIKRANCLETDGENLHWNNCLGFLSGCPEKEYRSNEIYQYSACQSINSQHNCYVAESSCPNITLNTTSSNTILDVQPTIPPPETSHVADIVGGLVAFLFILAVTLILAVVLKRRKKSQKKEKQEHISEANELLLAKVDETSDVARTPKENRYNVPRQKEPSFHEDDTRDEAKELLEEKVDETFPDKARTPKENCYNVPRQIEPSFHEDDTRDEAKELLEEKVDEIFLDELEHIYLGNYNTWETELFDKFSTLSDDEVLVLFCFLCSDSGPPDFTDTEWLDLLNEIRREVYDKYDPVTSEEAQQTLDRLKSRDYLWEDQDKITKDTKDETMYRVASIEDCIPFYYSSYNTASVYLRSQRYKGKPGEKCVISNWNHCDPLLILRLQMNILTHVTMKDTDIYNKIHQDPVVSTAH